jgi:hypothetical protein
MWGWASAVRNLLTYSTAACADARAEPHRQADQGQHNETYRQRDDAGPTWTFLLTNCKAIQANMS